MGSRKRADMDLESRAISARVTKQIVTIFSKACDNSNYWALIYFGICEKKKVHILAVSLHTLISKINILLTAKGTAYG